MRERERGAGCFIGCDLKQDGGSLRRIKEREEEKDAQTGDDVTLISKMKETKKP